MGAYRVGPVCIVYGWSYMLASGAAASAGFAPAFTTLLTVAGPEVPVMPAAPCLTTGLNAPVMPEYEKRGEYAINWPPSLPTPIIWRKLMQRVSSVF